jgi:peptidoglycan/xylan/chitin deacetylase (PgdA/CDA1 family)
MKKSVAITIDVEPDLTLYVKDSYIGVESGLPKIMNALEERKIKADLFITGDVCRKYPTAIKRIGENGHGIGNHGLDHEQRYFCKKNFKWQFENIKKSTEIISSEVGIKPKMFRAPNFSANGDTIRALEKIAYEVDSSVLPGRFVKKLRLSNIIDFRNAPVEPYNPSKEKIATKGDSRILEIPITENPFLKGSPIGSGFLNYCGLEKTLSAIDKAKSDYIVFLIHPWEFVDLGKHYPKIPRNWHSSCRDDESAFIELLESLKVRNKFVTLKELNEDYHAQSI